MAPMTVTTSFGVLSARPDGPINRSARPAPAVDAFLGIPYAAPPLGPLRFARPQLPDRWEEVRPAHRHGRAPIQGGAGPGRYLADLSSPTDSEDCLTLSIWTPAADPQAKLPVMVWLYGGAFVTGSTSVAAYDGAHLAARGVVVVALNYRLGLFGWLRCPDLGADGNMGLADQAAALQWVSSEIGAFGGDAGNITLFGESAGAASVAAHLAGSAPPLFRRAILQSGSHNLVQGAQQATDTTARLLAHLELPTERAGELRELPTETLRSAQDLATPRSGGVFYRPVTDGDLVPLDPAAVLAAGSGAGCGVPLLVGTNRDEMGFFWGRDESFDQLSDETLHALARRWHPDSHSALQVYRQARTARGDATDNRALAMAMGGDWSFRAALMSLAGWQSGRADAFAYRMDWASPLYDGLVGAAHVLDVPLVMGTYDDPSIQAFTGHDRHPEQVAAVSEQMAEAWVRFATTGDPGWARYEPDHRLTRLFDADETAAVVSDPQGAELRVWDALSQRR